MTFLYSCRHDGDQYRISKFTDQLEIESSYLVDREACECPAFAKRNRCKHQDMLPYFINRNAVGSGEMFDWDRGGWVRVFEDPQPITVIDEASNIPDHMWNNLPTEAPSPIPSVEAAEGGSDLPSAVRGFRSRF